MNLRYIVIDDTWIYNVIILKTHEFTIELILNIQCNYFEDTLIYNVITLIVCENIK